MPLCSICHSLDIRDLTDYDNDLQDVQHHKSLAALKESALSCPLCQLFSTQLLIEAKIYSPDGPDLRSTPIILRGRQYVDNDFNQGGIWQLKVRCDSARVRALFSLYPDQACPITIPRDIVVGGPIRPPEQRFDLLGRWVRQCNKDHKHCLSQAVKLPTRVVDVGEAGIQEPLLKETHGEIGLYMTLSHCWGAKHIIRTTKETLPQHQIEIPMDSLPKTFQDAITTTQMLRIRYLWIDSLCIIQDDAKDWEREAAVMGQIYAQSYLTIAAAASKDSSGGCFLPRPTKSHARVRCSVTDTETGYVYIREKAQNFDDLGNSILNTRAWVTQERLLSPRTIHFGVDQLLWECREVKDTEDTIPVDAFTTQKLLWDGRLKVEYLHPEGEEAAARFVWDWYQMVDNYTTRGLTVTDDKLPALSGLATVMEARTGDKYIAGLWKSHLTIGMLWRRIRGWLGSPAKYRAPSWSWTAWDGEVFMPEMADIESSINLFHPVAELIQVQIQPQGIDPNGKIASGSVTIKSRLKKADPRVDPHSDFYERYPEQGSGNDHLHDRGESIGWVNYDEDFKPGDSGPVFCLQMTVKPLFRRDLCHVLVLKPTDGQNEFRRIGLGCTGGGELRKGWFEGSSTSIVSII